MFYENVVLLLCLALDVCQQTLKESTVHTLLRTRGLRFLQAPMFYRGRRNYFYSFHFKKFYGNYIFIG